MIELNGEPELGMRLSDVRRFVEMTKSLDADIFVDCRVPNEKRQTEPAPLMGLACGQEKP